MLSESKNDVAIEYLLLPAVYIMEYLNINHRFSARKGDTIETKRWKIDNIVRIKNRRGTRYRFKLQSKGKVLFWLPKPRCHFERTLNRKALSYPKHRRTILESKAGHCFNHRARINFKVKKQSNVLIRKIRNWFQEEWTSEEQGTVFIVKKQRRYFKAKRTSKDKAPFQAPENKSNSENRNQKWLRKKVPFLARLKTQGTVFIIKHMESLWSNAEEKDTVLRKGIRY